MVQVKVLIDEFTAFRPSGRSVRHSRQYLFLLLRLSKRQKNVLAGPFGLAGTARALTARLPAESFSIPTGLKSAGKDRTGRPRGRWRRRTKD